ncbi:MaoC dehydratase-like protein [Tamaricihabitans halophyticus]|uniref:MaoC dehydratase-like protein n=1 Tax=Tamaricihabitans halophyticus TaxID=1262583 RepID=A0A4R2QTB2_9PSEU|nr:MaoC family dehydratase [Tamaricihabitans halophyticus]TCP53170.1 MaoC dehydratase-like protein [Tamaricihabitans halophyticus]
MTAVGDELPALTQRITRADLVRYAGASLDFNPIHWNERTALEVGLPDVIAHGMLTMAYAGKLVTNWLADPSALREYSVRFTRPVPVPDDDQGVELELSGKVGEVRDDGTARIDITARFAGKTVLGKAVAVVRLAS